MKKIYKNYLTIALKIIISLLAFYFVIEKILSSKDIKNFNFEINLKNILILIAIMFLMLINWFIESFKWKTAINQIEKISIFKAIKAILTGITVGSVTPNRIGEFGGRILYLKSENRKKTIPITLFADLSQLFITLIFGILGFLFLSKNINFSFSEIYKYENFIIFSSTFIIFIIILIYFYFEIIIKKILQIKFLKNFAGKYFTDKKIGLLKKFNLIFLSLLRYIVFNFQFYLALLFFKVDINILDSFIASSSMYLCLNVVPNLPFLEIGLRASFSIIFFGFFTTQTTTIVFASLLIYIINIAIPIIIGSIFLIKGK